MPRQEIDLRDRLALTERSGCVRIPVHVRPRSSRAAITGIREGALDVGLTSPPADGAANAELVKLIARALGVKQSAVVIAIGASSRSKVLEVSGMSGEDVRERLVASFGRRTPSTPPGPPR